MKYLVSIALLVILAGCSRSGEPEAAKPYIHPMCSFTRGDRTIADQWPAFVGEHGELICREEDAPK